VKKYSKEGGTIHREAYDQIHKELGIILSSITEQTKIMDAVNVQSLLALLKMTLDCVIRMK
jgi:hypothetical protein